MHANHIVEGGSFQGVPCLLRRVRPGGSGDLVKGLLSGFILSSGKPHGRGLVLPSAVLKQSDLEGPRQGKRGAGHSHDNKTAARASRKGRSSDALDVLSGPSASSSYLDPLYATAGDTLVYSPGRSLKFDTLEIADVPKNLPAHRPPHPALRSGQRKASGGSARARSAAPAKTCGKRKRDAAEGAARDPFAPVSNIVSKPRKVRRVETPQDAGVGASTALSEQAGSPVNGGDSRDAGRHAITSGRDSAEGQAISGRDSAEGRATMGKPGAAAPSASMAGGVLPEGRAPSRQKRPSRHARRAAKPVDPGVDPVIVFERARAGVLCAVWAALARARGGLCAVGDALGRARAGVLCAVGSARDGAWRGVRMCVGGIEALFARILQTVAAALEAVWLTLPFHIRQVGWLIREPAPPEIHASPRNARLRIFRSDSSPANASSASSLTAANVSAPSLATEDVAAASLAAGNVSALLSPSAPSIASESRGECQLANSQAVVGKRRKRCRRRLKAGGRSCAKCGSPHPLGECGSPQEGGGPAVDASGEGGRGSEEGSAAPEREGSRANLKSLMQDCGYNQEGRHPSPLNDLPRWRLENLVRGPIRDVQLYRTALTCPSAVPHRQGVRRSYDRLEFVGDAVLELVVRKFLYDVFPDAHEGKLTSAAIRLVQGRSVYNFARLFHLDRYIALNAEFMASPNYMAQWGGVAGVDIQCDAMEALVGAIEKDQGFEAARRFVMYLIRETVDQELLNKENNFKSLLLRAVGRRDGQDVTYRTKVVSTADTAVQSQRSLKVFVSEAWAGKELLGRGQDIHKGTAEANAAQAALSQAFNIDTSALLIGHKLKYIMALSDENSR